MQTAQELKDAIREKAYFLHKFLKSPRTIGSITPSSIYLVRAVIKPIDWGTIRSIVELGAGTGVFTEYIQRLKNPNCKAVIFEQDIELVNRLMQLYPRLDYHYNAEDVYSAVQRLGLTEVDCILSGLPFANFPQPLRDRILDGVVGSLKPGGLFIAFQYSLQMRNQLVKRFKRIDLCFVPLNIPPAFVYYCYK